MSDIHLEASKGALADLIAEHRALREAIETALNNAEQIDPQGSPEWRESGIAMRTTVIREVRAALNAN